jgi:branched-chain amino acid aminotransferase
MAFSPSKVVVNGDIAAIDNVNLVSIFSPSFQYGLNVFEGIRGYIRDDGKPHLFLFDQHLQRLSRSGKLLQLIDNDIDSVIAKDIQKLLEACPPQEDFYLKILLGYLAEGSWSTTSNADRILFWYPLSSTRGLFYPRSVRAVISSFERINNNSMPPQIKCGSNYINSRLGMLAARYVGAEVPIFLTADGFVSESSGSCIFRVIGNRVETPPISASILPSITREFILSTLSKYFGDLSFHEQNLTRWDLYSADEVFLAGTNVEIMPVDQIDQYRIGSDSQHLPVTTRLIQEFFNHIFD